MDSELIKRARAVMQKISEAPSAEPAAIEKQDSVVSARAILAEHDEAEVSQIMEVWRRLFGFSESYEHIASQLRALRQWQSKKPQVSGVIQWKNT
jgi:hypothetical protein